MTQEEILEDEGFVNWFAEHIMMVVDDKVWLELISSELRFHTAEEVYEYYKSGVEGSN